MSQSDGLKKSPVERPEVHVKRPRGRPKFTIEQHLKKPEPFKQKFLIWKESALDERTLKECEELLVQVYEKLGPTSAVNLLKLFDITRLRDLKVEHYDRFFRLCKEYLKL